MRRRAVVAARRRRQHCRRWLRRGRRRCSGGGCPTRGARRRTAFSAVHAKGPSPPRDRRWPMGSAMAGAISDGRWADGGWDAVDKADADGKLFGIMIVQDRWGRPVLLFRNDWKAASLAEEETHLELNSMSNAVNCKERISPCSTWIVSVLSRLFG